MNAGEEYTIEHVSSFDALSGVTEQAGPFIECSPELFKRLNAPHEKVMIYHGSNAAEAENPIAVGIILRGRLNSSLFVSVLRPITDMAAFWSELKDFCETSKIGSLSIEVIVGSDEEIDVEAFPEADDIVTSDLFLVDVFKEDLRFSSNHRRNINKARKAGVHLIEQSTEAAIADHFRLRDNSFDRRSARGEQIIESYPMRYISTGHAKIWQCGLGGEVMTSNLIVFGLDGAWHYESAGTSPEGFKLGSSQFLHAEIMEAARQAGIRWYDLGGGAPNNPGLVRFKEGFATHRWKKIELSYDFSPFWLQQIEKARSLASAAIGLLRG